MNRLAATIPSYIADNVNIILHDGLCRIDNLQLKNELLIQKSLQKASSPLPYLSKESTLSTSMNSTSNLLVHNDSNSKSKTNITTNDPKLEMIQSELGFLNDSLKALQTELKTNGQFTKFNQIINIEKANMAEFSKREFFEEKFTSQLDMYLVHQQEFEKLAEAEVKELRLVLMNLKTNKQELIQKHEMEMKLLQKQIVQKALTAKDVSQHDNASVLSETRKYHELTSIEMKASESIEREIRESCLSIIVTKAEAIKKYNYHKEEMVNTINKYEKNIKHVTDQIRKLLSVYKEYKEVVDEDQLLKELLRIEAKKQEGLNDLVKTIQNWWRCLVVRRDLISKPKPIPKKPKK